MGNEKLVKPVNEYNEYICICCNYKSSRKYDLEQHLATQKHKKMENIANGTIGENGCKTVNEKFGKKFDCLCGKKYIYLRGLNRHRETCNYQDPVCVEIKKPREGNVVALLIEQNKILMEQNKQQVEQNKQKDKQMMELLAEKDKQNKQQVELLTNTIKDMIPKMGSNNNNNTNQFNINMFLNEECKDAINMSDFIKSIQVSMDQLHYTTNNGLCKGLTKVIMDNMNKLSKYERPLHCSDIKREIIYIKDDDKWEKDTHKDKLKKAINKTSNKNYTALCDWTRENPTFMKQDDKQHFYARTASTIGKPLCDVEDKIIKSICKDNFIKE
jgi:hypothetical protein